jgi:hypothetical protein
MTADSARFWDIFLKALALIGVGFGGVFSYFRYFNGLKHQREAAMRESQKPFLTQRQELYGQALRAVAELSVTGDKQKLAAAEEAFWMLYWGPLASVESHEVESLMAAFGKCLENPACPPEVKKAVSVQLARQIRKESQKTWNVELPQLQDHTGNADAAQA